jgi:putative ABC transport system permease protein
MRIALRAGRMFGDDAAPRVAVVNEALARAVFPGEDPVGKHVVVGVMGKPERREIVGVVGDVRPTTTDSEPRPELYIPLAQSGNGSLTFVVRTAGDPAALLPALRDRVSAVDAGQVVYHAAAVPDLVSATLVERRFNLAIVSALSLVALLLAAVGIYGLSTFEASCRRREIGVRMALGARAGDVVRLIVRQGVSAVLPGVVIGLAGAAALTYALRRMLYGVAPVDPAVFVTLGVGVLAVAALASWFPARRAAAADPLSVIRE